MVFLVPAFMIIPYTQLDPDVLAAVLQDIVTRDGTDYGEKEITIEQKINQVRQALRNGQCFVVYDSISESVGMLTRQQALQMDLLPLDSSPYR